jgi:hypothetical protein
VALLPAALRRNKFGPSIALGCREGVFRFGCPELSLESLADRPRAHPAGSRTFFVPRLFVAQGTLTAGSGTVGFGTKLCGGPRTIAERAAKVMMPIATSRIQKVSA